MGLNHALWWRAEDGRLKKQNQEEMIPPRGLTLEGKENVYQETDQPMPLHPIQERVKRKRVSFAPGPLETENRSDVGEDGHPNHEGKVAERKRIKRSCQVEEPVTRQSLTFLEGELGPEYTPSMVRLRRRVGLLPLLRRHLPYLTRQSKKELTPREKADLEFLKAWNSGSPEQMEKLLPDVVPTEKQPDLESVAREEVKVFKNSCAMDSITSIRERKATPKKSFRLRMPGKGYVHFDQGLLAGLGFTEMRAHK